MANKGQVMDTRLSRELPKEKLEELYNSQWKTTTEIGKMFGCTRDAVVLRLHRYGIPLHGKFRGLDKETLRELYVDEQWSTIRIARYLGLKSDESVRKKLVEYDIPRRSKSEAQKLKVMTPEHIQKLREGASRINRGKVGPLHHAWKGGRWVNSDGYVVRRINKQSILEHRHFMQEHLGRRLMPWEEVNHINGDKQDNSRPNLEVIPSEHRKKDWYRRHPSWKP